MELLAGDARCIALDLPGFGHSESPPGGFTLDSAADLLAAALRALDAAPAVVCGHSLGGPLAARLAIRHPEAVSRLVLVGPSGLAPAPDWQHRVLRAVPVYNLLQRVPFRWERWLLPIAPLRHALLALLVDNPSARRSGTRAAHRRRRARRSRAHTRARPPRSRRASTTTRPSSPSRSTRSGAPATAWCRPATRPSWSESRPRRRSTTCPAAGTCRWSSARRPSPSCCGGSPSALPLSSPRMREPTTQDIDALIGPSTPHFAYQIRERVERLIAGPPGGSSGARLRGAAARGTRCAGVQHLARRGRRPIGAAHRVTGGTLRQHAVAAEAIARGDLLFALYSGDPPPADDEQLWLLPDGDEPDVVAANWQREAAVIAAHAPGVRCRCSVLGAYPLDAPAVDRISGMHVWSEGHLTGPARGGRAPARPDRARLGRAGEPAARRRPARPARGRRPPPRAHRLGLRAPGERDSRAPCGAELSRRRRRGRAA